MPEHLRERAKERLLKHRIIATTGCWLWDGEHLNRYSRTHVGKEFQTDVHRLSYMLFVGPIPYALHVLHRCDNKPCYNPEHLWIGTDKDNLNDMAAKGRHHNQRKTHCPYGHPLDGHTNRRTHQGFQRYCTVCDKERDKRRS